MCTIGRENGDDDVTVKILYCGVCHSDLHCAKNEWGFTNYPVVPGYIPIPRRLVNPDLNYFSLALLKIQ